MKSLLTIDVSKRTRRMLPVLLLLVAVAGCPGGTDKDQGLDPTGKPPNPPPAPVGSATIFVDQTRIPADGTTLVTAHATLTDARGIAIVGAPVVFGSTRPDITWLAVPDPNAADAGSLFPTECVAFTGTDGEAECIFRSGFVQGKAFIEAAGPSVLGLGASEEVEFTFAETYPGVILAALGDCESEPVAVPSGELPFKQQIAVQATAPQPGNQEALPIEDVRVYYTTTLGIWDRTLNNHSNDASDNAGISDQTLRLSTDENGKSGVAVMTAAGAIPVLCHFTVGNFTGESTLELTAAPNQVLPDGSAQQIALAVHLSDTANGGSAGPKVDHHITFSTAVGIVAPNPLTLKAGGTGDGAATLALSAQTTAALIPGESFTVSAVDDVSRAQASVPISVVTSGGEGIQLGLPNDIIEVPSPPPAAVQVRIKVTVSTTNGAVSGRRVNMDFGDAQPNAVATTDATGLAEFTHTFAVGAAVTQDHALEYKLTAVDVASNVEGEGSITFSLAAEETVTIAVPSQTVTIAASPTNKTVIITANVTVTNSTNGPGNRTVDFDFGDGSPIVTTSTNATGVASTSHNYIGVSDGDVFTVTALDEASNATGNGLISFQLAP